MKSIKIYVKKHSHWYCYRCGAEVEYEKHIGIDYPYYCPICNENMFKFETFRK